MRFLRAALTMAKTAVYSLHKTSTREVSSVSTHRIFKRQMKAKYCMRFNSQRNMYIMSQLLLVQVTSENFVSVESVILHSC